MNYFGRKTNEILTNYITNLVWRTINQHNTNITMDNAGGTIMGDKLLFTEEQKPLAKVIIRELAGTVFCDREPVILAISGKSGTGKSEVAHIVHDHYERLGIYTKLLCLDQFYVQDHEKNRVDTNYESVGLDEIDWSGLYRAVKNITHIRSHYMVIVEGLYALNFENTKGFYISQSYDDSYEFRVKRGKENPDCISRKIVLKKEAEVVRGLKEKADVILSYEQGE